MFLWQMILTRDMPGHYNTVVKYHNCHSSIPQVYVLEVMTTVKGPPQRRLVLHECCTTPD